MELRLFFLFRLVTRENASPVATLTPQCPLLSVHMSVRLFWFGPAWLCVCACLCVYLVCVCLAQVQFLFDDQFSPE